MNSLKITILAIALITVVGTASSTTLQNIEEIQPVGTQAIQITGEINLNGNSLNNIGSLGNCGTNQYLNGDGSCTTDQFSPDSTIPDDQQLSISGDTISLDNGGSVTIQDDTIPDTNTQLDDTGASSDVNMNGNSISDLDSLDITPNQDFIQLEPGSKDSYTLRYDTDDFRFYNGGSGSAGSVMWIRHGGEIDIAAGPLDLNNANLNNVNQINGKDVSSLGGSDGYIGNSGTHVAGGDIDVSGNGIGFEASNPTEGADASNFGDTEAIYSDDDYIGNYNDYLVFEKRDSSENPDGGFVFVGKGGDGNREEWLRMHRGDVYMSKGNLDMGGGKISNVGTLVVPVR